MEWATELPGWHRRGCKRAWAYVPEVGTSKLLQQIEAVHPKLSEVPEPNLGKQMQLLEFLDLCVAPRAFTLEPGATRARMLRLNYDPREVPRAIPAGLVAAADYMDTRQEKGDIISLEDVVKVHKLVMMNHGGGEEAEADSDALGKYIDELHTKVGALENDPSLSWQQRAQRLITIAAETLLWFFGHRPFKDGNARVAEVVCVWLLESLAPCVPFSINLWLALDEGKIGSLVGCQKQQMHKNCSFIPLPSGIEDISAYIVERLWVAWNNVLRFDSGPVEDENPFESFSNLASLGMSIVKRLYALKFTK
ncbi:hypothetical protein SELMODRAFT_410894 [Selaginella moellendorffii]|uniref:Fido domain-containing protein n=1 Tax=Selaginella moellendorffii TaxID=88036 RepID=D8RG77_SELML|nr:hypothetical protein SELMODRAFT_410894 [Selaginella moellendorffii]